MLTFLWPWAFAALPAPVLAWWLPRAAGVVSGAALRLPFFNLAVSASAPAQRPMWRVPLLLAVLAWALLVCALARPQWIGPAQPIKASGRNLMLAIDLSPSMRQQDMRHGSRLLTRIAAVQRVGIDFIRRRQGDRVGLIVFASHVYLHTPLTLDRDTTETMLAEAVVGLAGDKTAIGDAIGLAIKQLRALPTNSQVLVLLTDGEDNASTVPPLQAAKYAAQLGVRIYTIGVGADLAHQHRNVKSRRILQRIAALTDGRAFYAGDAAELQRIYALIDEREPTASEQYGLRPVVELYHWPLGIGWLIVMMLVVTPLLQAIATPWGTRGRDDVAAG